MSELTLQSIFNRIRINNCFIDFYDDYLRKLSPYDVRYKYFLDKVTEKSKRITMLMEMLV